jgi:hypothetical protein
MIIIGSAILLAIGLLVLLWQAIVICYHLIKLAVLLVIWCGYAVVLVAACCCLAMQYILVLVRWLKPEPVVTINILDDDDGCDDASIIDLPSNGFRRLRG